MQFLEKLWNMREKIDILNQSKTEKRRNYLVSEAN